MKAIIIDDENKPRRVIETLLKENFPAFDTIEQASNLLDGVALIKNHQPDIVFLDIEMPQHSGLKIFDYLGDSKTTFQLIFVTAYNKYAVEAFKLSALDYLLKPVSLEQFVNAVRRAIEAQSLNVKNDNFKALKRFIENMSISKIALEIPRGITFVSHDEIYYFEADGMYTKVFFSGNKQELICKPLKYFESQLKDNPFFYRSHRSYLVNLRHLKDLIKKDGFQLILDNGTSIPMTKTKYQEFLEIINEVF